MKKIGIDAGGTLTKIAYEENGRIHVKTYPNEQLKELIQWLQMTAPNARLYVTGGKRKELETAPRLNITPTNEFETLVKGTRFLLEQEKEKTEQSFVLVSIGTGTSIFYVTPTSYERSLGSGVGGGTWMGLGKLVSGEDSFHQLVKRAKKGDHAKSDLLVRDIYAPNHPPIEGSLTAANFGKAHVNETADTSDHLAALIQLIGETVLQLAGQVAAAYQVETIVFTGSTLDGNAKLQHVLSSFQDRLSYKPIFLDRGAYAGAIGALLER